MRPPHALEILVAALTPSPRREEVLGDLCERFTTPAGYMWDALRVVLAVVWGQTRRNNPLHVVVIELSGAGLCFAVVGGPVLIPALAMQVVFAIAAAYSRPRTPPRSLANASVAALCAWGIGHASALACAAAALTLVLSRRTLAPREPQAEGDHPMPTRADIQKELTRGTLAQFAAVALLAGLGVTTIAGGRPLDGYFGGAILALALFCSFQAYKRWRGLMPLPPRRMLERRIYDLRAIGWWYVLPFVIGLLLFAVRLPLTFGAPETVWVRILPFTILSIVWGIGVVVISRRNARRLQAEVDHLDDGSSYNA